MCKYTVWAYCIYIKKMGQSDALRKIIVAFSGILKHMLVQCVGKKQIVKQS